MKRYILFNIGYKPANEDADKIKETVAKIVETLHPEEDQREGGSRFLNFK